MAASVRSGKTRSALLSAGEALFGEWSVEAVSVDDIVQKAGVAKGSFYNHFSSKEELAAELVAAIRADAEARIGSVNAHVDDPAARIARALCVYAQLAFEHPERARLTARLLINDLSVDSTVNHGVVQDVADGLAQGRLAIPTVEAGALFVMAIGQVVIRRIIRESQSNVAISIAQQLVALELRGLGISTAEAQQLAAQSAHDIMCSAPDRS